MYPSVQTSSPSARGAFALLALLFLTATCVQAHDYWLEPEGSDYLLWRGHRHSQHAGEALVPYKPQIVRDVLCAGANGAVRPVTPSNAYPVRIPGPCTAVTVEADSGTWSQTLTGTKNQPPGELVGVLRSWRAIEGVKRLEAWSAGLGRPLSAGLEITPTADPFRLSEGEKLRLLVTFEGRPRAGVTVAYDDEPRGVTGADGRINLRIRHRGTQVITASIDETSPDGSKVVRSTALLFDLP